jgi:methylmalonyl-CoA mutase cobalamin-binding domain/chain
MVGGRILIGKPGLEGPDRGARYIVRRLREAGYEVVYTGIRRNPSRSWRMRSSEASTRSG